jgi:prepilin-type N-terminal cleavage/methylation domain-containing protein
MKTLRSSDGFTLVELMTVVLIIGVLVSVAIPVFASSTKRAQESTCLANQSMASSQAEIYRSREGTSPPTLQSLVDKRYFQSLPTCPAKGAYVWLSRTSGGSDILVCSVHYTGSAPPIWSTAWADPKGFKTIMGRWTTSNGTLTSDATQYQNRALFGDAKWTDVSIRTKAILNSGSGYGIYFRTTDTAGGPTGYCFQYDPGLGNKFVVRKVVKGVESGPIALSSMPAGFAVRGTSHDIQVNAVGSRIVVTVDGKVALDFTDSTFSAGQAGVRSWNKSSADFGAVSVYKATP